MPRMARRGYNEGKRSNGKSAAIVQAVEPVLPRVPPPPPQEPAVASPPPPREPAPVPQPPLLFEIGWEVCWQLGGIYTVLRTKAATMLERWGDRYCMIGPYNPSTAAVEFEDQPTY